MVEAELVEAVLAEAVPAGAVLMEAVPVDAVLVEVSVWLSRREVPCSTTLNSRRRCRLSFDRKTCNDWLVGQLLVGYSRCDQC